jgi:hypothetical protein
MSQYSKYAFLITATLLGAEAFVSPQFLRPQQTSLNLTPDQSDLLVAASKVAIYKSHEDDEDESFSTVGSTVAPLEHKKETAARAFAHKLFSLPSSVIKRHPHPDAEGVKDAVLYPVIGFKFVPVDGEYFALPTTCHAACRILNNKNEELVGWFKPPSC